MLAILFPTLPFHLTKVFKVIYKAKVALLGPLSDVPGPVVARWTNLVLKYHTLSGRRIQYLDSLFSRYG